MKRIATFVSLAAVVAGLACPAVAQAPAPTKTDLAPAAPTATSRPDAANSYQYPPNTGNIVSGANRTPYDPAPDGKTGNAPAGVAGGTTGTAPAKP